MKAHTASESEIGIGAGSEREPSRPWMAPRFNRLQAGLAETGPNASYDGVEGTS